MPREIIHNFGDALKVELDHAKRKEPEPDKDILTAQVLEHRNKTHEENLENRAQGAAA